MGTLVTALVTGLVAGAAHVVAGPDHLAALAPLAVDGRARPAAVGLRWGIGHGVSTIVLGAIALAGRELLPLDALSSASELVVGVVLVAIGLFAMRRLLRTRVHVHEHTHDGVRHVHVHAHAHAHDQGHVVHKHAAPDHGHGHAPFAVGALHGIAGGSHLLGVLPAVGIGDVAAGSAYLAGLTISSIVTMAVMTGFAGAVAGKLRRFERATAGLRWSAATAAVAVGLAWIAWA